MRWSISGVTTRHPMVVPLLWSALFTTALAVAYGPQSWPLVDLYGFFSDAPAHGWFETLADAFGRGREYRPFHVLLVKLLYQVGGLNLWFYKTLVLLEFMAILAVLVWILRPADRRQSVWALLAVCCVAGLPTSAILLGLLPGHSYALVTLLVLLSAAMALEPPMRAYGWVFLPVTLTALLLWELGILAPAVVTALWLARAGCRPHRRRRDLGGGGHLRGYPVVLGKPRRRPAVCRFGSRLHRPVSGRAGGTVRPRAVSLRDVQRGRVRADRPLLRTSGRQVQVRGITATRQHALLALVASHLLDDHDGGDWLLVLSAQAVRDPRCPTRSAGPGLDDGGQRIGFPLHAGPYFGAGRHRLRRPALRGARGAVETRGGATCEDDSSSVWRSSYWPACGPFEPPRCGCASVIRHGRPYVEWTDRYEFLGGTTRPQTLLLRQLRAAALANRPNDPRDDPDWTYLFFERGTAR